MLYHLRERGKNMKTKTVLLLFLLPIALFTPGVVNALDMEEYTDESFGFSVDYPAAWGIMPSLEGRQYKFFSAETWK